MKVPARTLMLLAAAAAGGCSYVKNRTNDLLDVFRFDVGWGPGLYAEARVTDFAALFLGYRDLQLAGMHGRFVGSATAMDLGLGPVVWGGSTQNTVPLLPGDTSQFDVDYAVPRRPMVGEMLVLPVYIGTSLSPRGLRSTDLGADVTLGYVSVGVGFSPGEFIDLLLGFFGIDLGGDDVFGREAAAADNDDDATD
jgi:hypothetical protein